MIPAHIEHTFRALDRIERPSTDTAYKPYVISHGQEDATHAGLGSVEAGTQPIRFWTVRFERRGRTYYDRVEAPDRWIASKVALTRNEGATCAQTVGEITRAEYDRFTRRSP